MLLESHTLEPSGSKGPGTGVGPVSETRDGESAGVQTPVCFGRGTGRLARPKAGRVGRWRGGGDPVMAGISSDCSITALSGRCPRIAFRDLPASPFPATPLRTVREVLPHTALHRP